MDRPRPIPQEIYRHFKGNLYQIVTIAIHSETREELVVYQALYGDYKTYCRPLSMFMSEVDRVKYPEVTQKYRFEKVEKALLEQPKTEKMPESGAEVKAEEKKVNHSTTETIREQFRNEPYKHSEVMDKTVDAEAEELNLDPLVIEFMDADLAADKNDILSKLRPVITNDMIDIMAMSLGVVVEEGDVYDRYADLRTCLTTMEKFESTRLRS
ncbi:Protein of unknown function [Butyrivibrio hungatei DSM 14810]|uniref:DUF1653 domain-containing protein n=2 Tax=Butyrivibrio hungatei TaxID=185008 RepID=A0A1D9P235_9FIRM|nr:DUF1653 domain-containing protein [Butyrivibrio hungatei]AOZ96678.1 hypothetical protein bhn_I1645 [Butyrivibrio hungatei]SHN55452.1 Protein of unknown function [Butyrivibrio hungatei DSM 14810]